MRRGFLLWWQRLTENGPRHFGEAWLLALFTLLSQGTRAAAWVRTRRRKKPRRLRALVLGVGNLTVGGTGKTPVVRALAEEMRSRGFRVAVACQAYRAEAREPVQVPNRDPEPAFYGDEPTLLSFWLKHCPVYVARRRADAAALAAYEGAQVVILDDGFQTRGSLYRDLDFLVMPARRPFGNRKLLPAGPLRESPEAMRDAPAVIMMRSGDGSTDRDGETQIRRVHPSAVVIPASLEVRGLQDLRQAGRRRLRGVEGRHVLAFCGIGQPARFVRSLYQMGAATVHLLAFDDHHAYGREDLEEVTEAAGRRGCDLIVTTEKDAVKLRALLESGGRGRSPLPIEVLRIEAVLDSASLDFVLKPLESLCPR